MIKETQTLKYDSDAKTYIHRYWYLPPVPRRRFWRLLSGDIFLFVSTIGLINYTNEYTNVEANWKLTRSLKSAIAQPSIESKTLEVVCEKNKMVSEF